MLKGTAEMKLQDCRNINEKSKTKEIMLVQKIGYTKTLFIQQDVQSNELECKPYLHFPIQGAHFTIEANSL